MKKIFFVVVVVVVDVVEKCAKGACLYLFYK